MARVTQSKAAARQAQALKIRRNILAAQLRVALDAERKRPTPEAVVRLSKMPLPEVAGTAHRTPLTRERHMAAH